MNAKYAPTIISLTWLEETSCWIKRLISDLAILKNSAEKVVCVVALGLLLAVSLLLLFDFYEGFFLRCALAPTSNCDFRKNVSEHLQRNGSSSSSLEILQDHNQSINKREHRPCKVFMGKWLKSQQSCPRYLEAK